MVAAFNLQGAAYDRSRRAFHVHDASPPRLTAGVGVHDVPGLAARCSGLPVIAYCDADEVSVFVSGLGPHGSCLRLQVARGLGKEVVRGVHTARHLGERHTLGCMHGETEDGRLPSGLWSWCLRNGCMVNLHEHGVLPAMLTSATLAHTMLV